MEEVDVMLAQGVGLYEILVERILGADIELLVSIGRFLRLLVLLDQPFELQVEAGVSELVKSLLLLLLGAQVDRSRFGLRHRLSALVECLLLNVE